MQGLSKLKKRKTVKHEEESVLDSAFKTHCVYSETVDGGKIYTDETGRFPVVSSRGNTYIMNLYEYDGNAIMTESITIEQQVNFREHSKSWNKNELHKDSHPDLLDLTMKLKTCSRILCMRKNTSFQLLPAY
jgi:hypothetical protein